MFDNIENHGRTGTFAPTGVRYDVDFDFNILTAFIRLGRAGPVGAGCPPYNITIENKWAALCPPYSVIVIVIVINVLQPITFLKEQL